MRVLLTGGAGYIGSHTAVALSGAGHDVVCFDNLSNSSEKVMDRIAALTGKRLPFVLGDIRDRPMLEAAIRGHGIEAVVHFAGLKAVGESVEKPALYYDNNVCGTLRLVEAMAAHGVRRLVFSSSATVYGDPQYLPLDERHPLSATNPYGRTKLIVEQMLGDLATADSSWRIAVLRYFNPVGAHESGLIGEDPSGHPNNLMPYICRVAAGRLGELAVYGGDYETPDGTGVRDYIHVADLAAGHVAALNAIASRDAPLSTWNLGTGQGHSVLEMIAAFERVNDLKLPFRIAERRPGDVAACYADAGKARAELGWQAALGLDEMCRSAWAFELKSGRGA